MVYRMIKECPGEEKLCLVTSDVIGRLLNGLITSTERRL